MALAMHQRVKIMKPGSDLNKIGSITFLTDTQVGVVIDDGSDQQSGGQLAPPPPKMFALDEVGPT